MEALVYKSPKGNPVTNSLIVAEVFEKNHQHVMESIREIMRSVENSTHLFGTSFYVDSMNRTQPMFIMTEDGFSLLAMGFTGERALQWKLKYINAFKKLREIVTDYMAMVPKTYASALELAAKQAKELEEKEKIIALQAPKVDFADRVIDTDNMVDIGQASKLLKLPFGRNIFFQKLREQGIFFKNRNEPKQEYVERGYFELRQKYIERNNHPAFSITKVLTTQKGLFWLSKTFGGNYHGSLPELNLQ